MKLFSTLDTIANCLLTGCAASVISVLLYIIWFEKPYLSYTGGDFVVMKSQLNAGDKLPMIVERCNSDKIPRSYSVSRALREVNTGNIIPMDPFYSLAMPGCNTAHPSLVHKIPIDTPPGRYVFFGGAEVHGTVRTFDINFKSQQFDVVAK